VAIISVFSLYQIEAVLASSAAMVLKKRGDYFIGLRILAEETMPSRKPA
jgi:hypothetical protein